MVRSLALLTHPKKYPFIISQHVVGFHPFSTTNDNNNNNATSRDKSSKLQSQSQGAKSRSDNRYKRFNNNKQSSSTTPSKENFAKKILEPASRGELIGKHHTSGIPKLAARKSKGHGIKDPFLSDNTKSVLKSEKNLNSGTGGRGKSSNRHDAQLALDDSLFSDIVKASPTSESTESSSKQDEKGNSSSDKISLQSVVEKFSQGRKHKKSSSSSSSGSPTTTPTPTKDISHLFTSPTPTQLNAMEALESNITWLGPKFPISQQRFKQQRRIKHPQQSRAGDDKVYDLWGDEISTHELSDPWLSSTISMTHENLHPESKREAVPIVYPSNRTPPSKEFVEGFTSYMYVSNIPHPLVESKSVADKGEETSVPTTTSVSTLGKFQNPLDRSMVAEYIANLLNVDITQVSPATMTSAFIGFTSEKDASDVYAKTISRRLIQHKLNFEMYTSNTNSTKSAEEVEFVSTSPSKDAIVQIMNLSPGMKKGTLARYLHPIVQFSANDIYFSSPTTALLRFSTSEEAKSFLHNQKNQSNNNNKSILQQQQSLTKQMIRIQPAHREIVHDKFVGPGKFYQQKKQSTSLVVHGDVPSSDFFKSHAYTLHLCNIPPNSTKIDISQYFQKYCVEPRDIQGSIEFVNDLDGQFTGRAYVGFDLEEEGLSAWKDIFSAKTNQRIELPNNAGLWTRVQPVQEKLIRRGRKLQPRSNRSEEELWDSLTNWEQYVDPEDIQELESMGVTKDVLEDAFMAVRFNNPTFGVEDQARSGERLRKQKRPGQQFREFVRLYVETMKEVMATRENPGMLFEGMFMQDEEMDLSLFDAEEERLRKLREKNAL